jgi:hypothetical protein
VLVWFAAICAVASSACGSHDDASDRTAAGREKQARDLARRAGLSSEVQDFVASYAAASGHRFQVTYAPSSSGTTVVLVQDPPRRRVDLVTPPVTRSIFVTKEGTFNCALDNQKWSCQKSAQQESTPGLLSPADVAREVSQLQSAKPDYDFRVSTRKIAGTSARCLAVTPRKGAAANATSSQWCVSGEGAVLLFEGSGNANSLRAVRYSTDVDERRLELPAPPSPVPAAP